MPELRQIATGERDNPNLDSEYAKETMFTLAIIHGILRWKHFLDEVVFGTMWPGEGTIYLKQT